MGAILAAILRRKLKAALSSSTMGVSGLLMLGAVWVSRHPDIVAQVSPKWGGTIVAAAALVVAIARARSL